MRRFEHDLRLDSNSPYSFHLSLMSIFPCFGTNNQRFQAFHRALGRMLGFDWGPAGRRVPICGFLTIKAT